MEDFIVYLIFIAFALLSRLLGKKKEKNFPPKQNPQSSANQEPRRPQRQPTFEELLREFTGEGETTPKPQPTREVPKSYEDEEYEIENYEESYRRDEEAREIYSRSVKQAKDIKTIDELVDYNQIKTTYDHFDPYEQKKKDKLADKIRLNLQNRDEIKKAIIYSEILKRKY